MAFAKKRFSYLVILFFLFAIISSHFVSAEDIYYDLYFEIDAGADTIYQDILIDNRLGKNLVYREFTFSAIPDKIYTLLHEGDCERIRERTGTFEGEGEYAGRTFTYNYLECSPKGRQFERGEQIRIKITGECNCTNKFGGIIKDSYGILVRPYTFNPGENGLADVRYKITFPKEYFLHNSSIPGISLKETAKGTEVTFNTNLAGGQDALKLYSIDDFFIDFRRRFDFSNPKILEGEYQNTSIVIKYPTGFEKGAAEILQEFRKILPYYESYGAVNFENITFNIETDAPLTCGGSGGCAYPSEESINISINQEIETFYHELCHLTEKPFDFPSWFAEGEATNCESAALRLFGFSDKAKKGEDYRIEGSRLGVDIDFQRWKASENRSVETEDANRTNKGYGLSFVMMKEILKSTNLTQFYINYREFPETDEDLGSDIKDNLIFCKLNEVSSKDLRPLFEENGFKGLRPCEEVYEEVESQRKFSIFLAIGLIAVFFAIILLLFYYLFRKFKRRKRKK